MKTAIKNKKITGSGHCHAGASELGTKVHPLLKDYFGYCFYKGALIIRERIAEKVLDFGLVPPHLGLLRLLKDLGEHSQNQLAEQLGIDKATMVKLIDQLEKLKLIERTQEKKDRRIWKISITSAGEKVLAKVSVIRHQVESDFLSCLTEAEKKVLLRCIPQLLDNNRSSV
ncbi:MAG: MarR family transcriptional regulator [Pseudobdellovibrio sp.]